MAIRRFEVLSYWTARRESVDQCADRLLQFFSDLMPCDDTLARWFRTGRSRKDAMRYQVQITDRQKLIALLQSGRNRTDVGKQIIHELGFGVYLWNGGNDDHAVSLTLKCGSYAEHSLLPNNVILNLADEIGGLSDVARMISVLEATALAWEPVWAGVISSGARDSRPFPADPFIDWMVYMANEWLPTVPDLPPPASVKRMEKGTLIVVQNEPPDPANRDHLENIRRVESALRSVWTVPVEFELEAEKLRQLYNPD